MPIEQKRKSVVRPLQPLEYKGFGDFFRETGRAAEQIGKYEKQKGKQEKPVGYDELVRDFDSWFKTAHPSEFEGKTARELITRFKGRENKWTDAQRSKIVGWYLTHGGSDIKTNADIYARVGQAVLDNVRAQPEVAEKLYSREANGRLRTRELVNKWIAKNTGYKNENNYALNQVVQATIAVRSKEHIQQLYYTGDFRKLEDFHKVITDLKEDRQITSKQAFSLYETLSGYTVKLSTKTDKDLVDRDNELASRSMSENNPTTAYAIKDENKRRETLNTIYGERMSQVETSLYQGQSTGLADLNRIKKSLYYTQGYVNEEMRKRIERQENFLADIFKVEKVDTGAKGFSVTSKARPEMVRDPIKARYAYMIQSRRIKDKKSDLSLRDFSQSFSLDLNSNTFEIMKKTGVDPLRLSDRDIKRLVQLTTDDYARETGDSDKVIGSDTDAVIMLEILYNSGISKEEAIAYTRQYMRTPVVEKSIVTWREAWKSFIRQPVPDVDEERHYQREYKGR